MLFETISCANILVIIVSYFSIIIFLEVVSYRTRIIDIKLIKTF